MRRETIIERISLLPPEIQIILYGGTAIVFSFFLWTIFRVRRRIGPERWSATPLVFRLIYLWPLMTKTERVLFMLTAFGFIGWGYIVFSVLNMVAPPSG